MFNQMKIKLNFENKKQLFKYKLPKNFAVILFYYRICTSTSTYIITKTMERHAGNNKW